MPAEADLHVSGNLRRLQRSKPLLSRQWGGSHSRRTGETPELSALRPRPAVHGPGAGSVIRQGRPGPQEKRWYPVSSLPPCFPPFILFNPPLFLLPFFFNPTFP